MTENEKWGPRFYFCAKCKREITFANCLYMSHIDADDDSFTVFHECVCSPSKTFERSFKLDASAMRRFLRGLRPILPYKAAPHQSLPLTTVQEKALTLFRWECDQLSDVDEFLLFATPPQRPRR